MGLLNKKLSDWTANDAINVYLAKDFAERAGTMIFTAVLPTEEEEELFKELRGNLRRGQVPEGGWAQYEKYGKHIRKANIIITDDRDKHPENWPAWLFAEPQKENIAGTAILAGVLWICGMAVMVVLASYFMKR
jgi:hypothetical protein